MDLGNKQKEFIFCIINHGNIVTKNEAMRLAYKVWNINGNSFYQNRSKAKNRIMALINKGALEIIDEVLSVSNDAKNAVLEEHDRNLELEEFLKG